MSVVQNNARTLSAQNTQLRKQVEELKKQVEKLKENRKMFTRIVQHVWAEKQMLERTLLAEKGKSALRDVVRASHNPTS